MWISDTSGQGHGDKSGDKSRDNTDDNSSRSRSGDKSGEMCVNKRCAGISPTLYAEQSTRSDIHNSRFIVYDIFRERGLLLVIHLLLSRLSRFSGDVYA